MISYEEFVEVIENLLANVEDHIKYGWAEDLYKSYIDSIELFGKWDSNIEDIISAYITLGIRKNNKDIIKHSTILAREFIEELKNIRLLHWALETIGV